ncbi:MAG: hypothetical protein ABIM21_07830 [candidate division WOR-3 bacterium]
MKIESYVNNYSFGITGKPIETLRSAAESFSSLLIGTFLKEAFRGFKNPILNGEGEFGIYREILIWHFSDYIARSKNSVITEMLYEKFKAVKLYKETVGMDDIS